MRTRILAAGISCSPSAELPASTEGYSVLRSAAPGGRLSPEVANQSSTERPFNIVEAVVRKA